MKSIFTFCVCPFNVCQIDFVGFPDKDEAKTPTKRSYRSQNNQVDLALSLQEKQNMLMERMVQQNDRIVEQNDMILDQLKQINEQLSKQNNTFFRY